MSARSRLRVFALACVATLAVCNSAFGAFSVDTSRLPRISGSRELYASPGSTSFITRESVARAFELTASALIEDDWQPYDDPFTARTSDSSARSMSFKKEGRALSLVIATSPAQANATSVSYPELMLRNDLPFPKDATRIKFDSDRPYLSFVTGRDAESMLDFFRDELKNSGWSLWSARDGAPQADDGIAGELTGEGAIAYYLRDNNRTLMLTLTRRDDYGFNVELTAIPSDRLAARSNGADAASALREIPVPQASEDVDFDGARGMLSFTNPASGGIVAEYYRSMLQQRGWHEQPAAPGNAEKMMLRFANDVSELSISICQAAGRTKVTMEGSALQVAAALSRSL